MHLVLDIGNTGFKAGIFKNKRLVKFIFLDRYSRISAIKKIFTDYPGINACIGSSVAGDVSKLSQLTPPGVFYVTYSHELQLPLANLYRTPVTLGSDRIAGAVGANEKYRGQNILVIDAGTCLTFDFVDAANAYQGGSISPGLAMRFKALHEFTRRLPLIRQKKSVSFTGKSTEDSILSGVVNGLCAEIDGMIERYSAKYKSLKVVFTGGDSQFLIPRLSQKNRIFADPYLVLRGLNTILKRNRFPKKVDPHSTVGVS